MYKSLQIKTLGSDGRENEQENFIKNLKLINQMENRSSDSQETNGVVMTDTPKKNYSISLTFELGQFTLLHKELESDELDSQEVDDLLYDYGFISECLDDMADKTGACIIREDGECKDEELLWFESTYSDYDLEMIVRYEQKRMEA
jgi:hypothetical protein